MRRCAPQHTPLATTLFVGTAGRSISSAIANCRRLIPRRMVIQRPPPYGLKTRRCTIHAGHFRWDILERGKAVQSSAESYVTRHDAEVAGRAETERLSGFGGSADKDRPSDVLYPSKIRDVKVIRGVQPPMCPSTCPRFP
jgi:hypothetical protein